MADLSIQNSMLGIIGAAGKASGVYTYKKEQKANREEMMKLREQRATTEAAAEARRAAESEAKIGRINAQTALFNEKRLASKQKRRKKSGSSKNVENAQNAENTANAELKYKEDKHIKDIANRATILKGIKAGDPSMLIKPGTDFFADEDDEG